MSRTGSVVGSGYGWAKIINYKIRKLAEIDRHEEFVVADFYL